MKKFFKSFIIVTILSIFLLMPAAHAKTFLVLIDGSTGTTWYLASAKIAEVLARELPDLSVNVTLGGGVSNVHSVNKKESDLGTSFAKTCRDAVDGKPPFDSKLENIRGMVSLYGSTGHIVTLKKYNITRVEQLKDKRIAVGRRGFSAERWAKSLLETHGLSYENIEQAGGMISFSAYGEARMMMADGHLDAIFVLGSLPTAFILELQATQAVDLIKVSDQKLKEFRQKHPGYIPDVIPAGTYKGQNEDIKTTGDGSILLIHKDVSEDLVYNMTKTILENYEEIGKVHVTVKKGLKPENALKYLTIPVHPGAMRYYKEKGLMK